MAKKNLMAQENGQYYNSMQAVERNVENYMNLVQGFKMPESDYIKELITKLETLLGTLRMQEKTFYSQIGIKGANQLRDLQKKIDFWNNTGASALLEQKTVQGVYDCVVATIDEGQFLEFVNEYLADNTEWIQEELDEAGFIGSNIADFFNTVFADLISSKQTQKFKGGSVGIEGQIELTRKNGKYQIKTLTNSKISNGMKGKLLKIVQSKLKESPSLNASIIAKADKLIQTSGDRETVDENIINFLCSIIPASAMNYIIPEIKRKDGAYARWANYFVIQGYLGEVYWNACMHYLFGQQGDIRALGNTKNLSGKSLSVDLFANGAGFQIKSWRLKEVIQEEQAFQTHTSNTSMYFGNFLQSRAQILDEMAGQIIARMFGSISYNLPNPERGADKITQGNSTPYSKFYDNSNKEWPNTMDDLALMFRANLSEILGISGKNAIAESGEVYYNTFWAINDKIIPSSLIVEELIHAIRSASETSLVDLEVNLKNTKKTPAWDTPPSNMSDLAMANRWKIEYSTCFNMTRLLDVAAKRA